MTDRTGSTQPAPRDAFDPGETLLCFGRDGAARVVVWESGPPPRLDGLAVSAPLMERAPPHAGERHPDGDELLVLLSGRIEVVLEDEAPPRRVELRPGQALVVPRGVWHRAILHEPSRVLHVTPGPGGEHRPLGGAPG